MSVSMEDDVDATAFDCFNLTDDPTTLGFSLPRLFERTVDSYPDKTALVCASTELSYGGLSARVNQVSVVLVERGIRPGDVVGIALDRSIELVVVLLAVLKSGAAYVPIDPALPVERMAQMIEDAVPQLIVAGAGARAAVASLTDTCVSIDEIREGAYSHANGNNLEVNVQPDDIAYIIYTSGSTGKPKGVEISHGALCNFVLSMHREPGCSDEDRLLAISTISFDMAVYELFTPLTCGAAVVVAQTHQLRDAGALLGLISQHAVTMMLATPTTWQMLLDIGWRETPRLKTIMAGGEGLSKGLAEQLLDRGDTVWNKYGPTEATACSSIWRVQPGEDVIIGNPITNARLYVLDADLSPVPPGDFGELFIGGAGLARGYRRNSELTQSNFLQNPFHEGRLYRTGDLARFLDPERLALLGRSDDQVKIRGHRIEVGEIEAALAAHYDVSTAAVTSRDGRLVAYYIMNVTSDAVQYGREGRAAALDGELRAWLHDRLPAYMVPAFFVALDVLPVTFNGKIDRKALPDPLGHLESLASTKFSTELERHISDVWTRVLGHRHISLDDNFFHVGGDSARIVRVQAELTQLLGRPVSSAKLFEYYTIRTLSEYLAGEDDETSAERAAMRNCVSRDEPIAIVSVACRLPGGVDTPEDLWGLLDGGVDAITDVPKDRWDAEALYDADPQAAGKSYCRKGGFLASIDTSDSPFFGISPREARELDPTQVLMMEICWEALERAGYTTDQLRGSRTGVFIGTSSVPAYNSLGHKHSLADLDGYMGTGSAGSTMSGRISYTLGLEGPALTVDTACSSSLVATHLACNALRLNECDAAIAGGASLLLSPGLHVEFSRLGGMSADGRCRAFAADSQGTGWGEGGAAVLLKRLSDAERDGDTVHAVLTGTAVNHGGRSSAGLTVPSGAAQRRLLRAALAESALQPGDVDYIEAHGTGTRLGDPIEGTALADVFGGSHPEARPLWIGSVKSNIGHTQAAAGLVGLLKTVLAMRYGTLPQSLHAVEPTPLVDWRGACIALVGEKRPWMPKGCRPRRAGVSAFGVSGTNAHVIVEEPPKRRSRECAGHVRRLAASANAVTGAQPPPRLLPLPQPVPVVLSGDTEAALRRQADKLYRHLRDTPRAEVDPDRVGDVAYSLATTRSHFRHRTAFLAKDEGELLDKLAQVSATGPEGRRAGALPPPVTGRLAMVFTGQGSQLPGMGRQLAEKYTVFREALYDIASHFDETLDRTLLDVMWADGGTDEDVALLLRRTDYAQPALFTLEVALWRLWESWGVRPELVLGHSCGELAAAHVAGVLDLADACRLVAARGRVMEEALPGDGQGGMSAVPASPAEVTASIAHLRLEGKVGIAGHNTPAQTVVSGDADALLTLTAQYAAQGRSPRSLEASRAFHSHHMDGEPATALEAATREVRLRAPTLAFVSTLTGRLTEPGELEDPTYWVRQARNAVRFSDAVQTAVGEGITIFLELGPRPVLCGMGAACLAGPIQRSDAAGLLSQAVWLPSLATEKRSDTALIQDSLTTLHVHHVPVDWRAYFAPFDCRRVALPTYAFDRERRLAPGARVAAATTANASPIEGPASPVTPVSCVADRRTAPASDRAGQESCFYQFEIDWQPVKAADCTADGDDAGSGGLWGLLYPAGPVPWAQETTDALSRSTGMRFIPVNQLDDALKLDGLLCFWHSDAEDVDAGADADPDLKSADNVVCRARDLSIVALLQLQRAAQVGLAAPLVWVTRDAVGARVDDRLAGLGAGPLWGLMRTARSEHPELRLRLIDLERPGTAADVGTGTGTAAAAAAVLAELNAAGLGRALTLRDETEFAVRRGQVLVPRMQPVDRAADPVVEPPAGPPVDSPLRLRSDGAVLITGGLGDLGARVARWLASQHGVRDLVLTSRRGKDAGGAEAVVADLTALGAAVTVLASDVANLDSIRSVVSQFGKNRPLRGVVHAAGVPDAGVLSTLTPARCATTFSPKVDGAWNLHRLTRDMDLDLFILFSSVSGVMGMPGLAIYAAANVFLDALAHRRRAMGLESTSVAFGTWQGDGMAATHVASTRSHLQQLGLDPLVPDRGLALLGEAARSRRALTVAAALDPARLRDYFSQRGGIPPLLRTLLGRGLPHDPGCDHGDAGRGIYDVVAEAAPEAQADVLLRMVRELVATALGFAASEDVDVYRPLQDIGIDSLTAVLMRNHLAELTGVTLSANFAFVHRNLHHLSQSLLTELRDSPVGTSLTASASGGVTPTTTASDGDGIPYLLSLAAIRKGCLDPDITFGNVTQAEALARSPRSVFVTGATGFVGAFVVGELLERDIAVNCLVRADDDEHARQRVVSSLSRYGLWRADYEPILGVVVGDLVQPLLGLTEDVFNDLADRVDAICHAGGLVDWMRPLDDYVGPNIISTHEVLRLASRGRGKAVHFVSTIATVPRHLGYDVSEDEYEYCYATSKLIAERMMAAARWRGARAFTYRMPFITAAASTGHFRLDRGDFLHNLVVGSIDLGSFPSLGADLSIVLPVDYLCKTMINVVTSSTAVSRTGRDYDFHHTSAPTFDYYFNLMITAGYGQRLLLFSTWRQRALAYAAEHPTSPLARIATVLDGCTDAAIKAMFQAVPPGEHVLGGDEYPVPRVDEVSVSRYLHRINSA